MDRQTLKSKFKQACDILRNEIASVNYIIQLSWMLFLKLYDELEDDRELKAKLKGQTYKRNIPSPYMWKEWVYKDWRSEELVKFINNDLFPFLAKLNGNGERELISTIFSGKEIQNFLSDGYKLREVALLLDEIKLKTKEDIYVISTLYEELLPEIGEMGKYAGEYYTPRPIIRLMVKIINPKLGETILDPFMGSGGFLIESYNHILKSKEVFTTKETQILNDMFMGEEKKDVPYLIGIMNSLLHNLPTTRIYKTDTFSEDIRKIQEKDRVNIILTNPPFGGKFDERFKSNFPVKSSDTELMALQYVMRKIRQGGRVGIVVPEGVLSNTTGPFVRVRKELLENYNVHTIISLPKGVFTASGKTPVKTNLLFFEKTTPTDEIWYYEHKHPLGMVKTRYGKWVEKQYTKTDPIRDEYLIDCYEKWKNREVSENSWIVKIEDIDKETYELTPRNPNNLKKKKLRPAEEILEDVLKEEKEVTGLLAELKSTLENAFKPREGEEWRAVKLKEVAEIIMGQSPPSSSYNKEGKGIMFLQGNKEFGELYPKPIMFTTDPKKLSQKNDILISVRAPVGEVNIADKEYCIGRGLAAIRFKGEPKYLFYLFLLTKEKIEELGKRGTTFRAVTKNHLSKIKIPLLYRNGKPNIERQKEIADYLDMAYEKLKIIKEKVKSQISQLDEMKESILDEVFSYDKVK